METDVRRVVSCLADAQGLFSFVHLELRARAYIFSLFVINLCADCAGGRGPVGFKYWYLRKRAVAVTIWEPGSISSELMLSAEGNSVLCRIKEMALQSDKMLQM